MDVVPLKKSPLHVQVEEFIRDRIVAGIFAPGTQLPSTNALARLTGTSICTVHSALARLGREGLLDRRPNKPTFVRGKKPALTCAGVYFNRPLARKDMAFYQTLSGELQQRLEERGVKCQLWSDDRSEEAQTEPFAALRKSIERREIQALFALLICERDMEWIGKLPIPSAILTSDSSVKNGVNSDHVEMLRLGLRDFASKGCRTVGLINNMVVSDAGDHGDGSEFYRSFMELAAEAGLATRNEWIRFPVKISSHLSHYGYEQFQRLWDLDRRPDGLLVHPDNAVAGVITAILERRVSVPRDLKVVFHANDLLPYPCPVPASFLVSKVGRYADALIAQIDDQLAGKPVEARHVPLSIENNPDFFHYADIT